jgi:hypothetical protein
MAQSMTNTTMSRTADAPEALVPCNGCTACCRNTAPIGIWPSHGDNLAFYIQRDMVDEFVETIDGHTGTGYALRRKPDGDCHFVGESAARYTITGRISAGHSTVERSTRHSRDNSDAAAFAEASSTPKCFTARSS